MTYLTVGATTGSEHRGPYQPKLGEHHAFLLDTPHEPESSPHLGENRGLWGPLQGGYRGDVSIAWQVHKIW